MQDNHRFYLCRRDGTLVGLIHGGGGELTCCGEPMEELTAAAPTPPRKSTCRR